MQVGIEAVVDSRSPDALNAINVRRLPFLRRIAIRRWHAVPAQDGE